MKLAIYLIDNHIGSDATTSALSQISELNSADLYLLWQDYGTYNTLRFTPGTYNSQSINDLQQLIKLLLAHPALGSRPGLVTPMQTQMLNLLGIPNSTVETFRDELQQHSSMIITASCLLLKEPLPFSISHHLCFRLHSNFRSLIKKASLNLLQIPSIASYNERLTHDFTL